YDRLGRIAAWTQFPAAVVRIDHDTARNEGRVRPEPPIGILPQIARNRSVVENQTDRTGSIPVVLPCTRAVAVDHIGILNVVGSGRISRKQRQECAKYALSPMPDNIELFHRSLHSD